jgi:hypothetical protein
MLYVCSRRAKIKKGRTESFVSKKKSLRETRKPESRPWCHSFYTVHDAWDGYRGLHRQKKRFLKETT